MDDLEQLLVKIQESDAKKEMSFEEKVAAQIKETEERMKKMIPIWKYFYDEGMSDTYQEGISDRSTLEFNKEMQCSNKLNQLLVMMQKKSAPEHAQVILVGE